MKQNTMKLCRPERGAMFGRVLSMPLPRDPDQRVDATIYAMAAIVHNARRLGIIQQLSTRLLWDMSAEGIDAARPEARWAAVFAWLREVFRYRPDPTGAEMLRIPEQHAEEIRTTGRTVGDCDELATFTAAILDAWGDRVALVAVGRDPSRPYAHVLAAGLIDPSESDPLKPGNLFPIDPQEAQEPGEWPTPRPERIKAWLLPAP